MQEIFPFRENDGGPRRGREALVFSARFYYNRADMPGRPPPREKGLDNHHETGYRREHPGNRRSDTGFYISIPPHKRR